MSNGFVGGDAKSGNRTGSATRPRSIEGTDVRSEMTIHRESDKQRMIRSRFEALEDFERALRGTPYGRGEEAVPRWGAVSEALVAAAVNVGLIDEVARGLPDVGKEPTAPGHRPSWLNAQVPDGRALCVGCGQPIVAQQLGTELCPGPRKPHV
jgi:hypothetical protein